MAGTNLFSKVAYNGKDGTFFEIPNPCIGVDEDRKVLLIQHPNEKLGLDIEIAFSAIVRSQRVRSKPGILYTWRLSTDNFRVYFNFGTVDGESPANADLFAEKNLERQDQTLTTEEETTADAYVEEGATQA
jgi:hypothetical protein